MNSNRITAKQQPSSRRGFSLPEITISVALLSTITIALGIALFRTQHRASDAQADFSDRNNRNNVIRQITDDLHYATEVNHFLSDAIVCLVPDTSQAGTFKQIGYSLDTSQNTLVCLRGPGNTAIIAKNVTLFQITAQTTSEGSNTYFKSITIKLQIGTDSQTLVERIIPLANRPIFNSKVVG
jgi:type II secretory pathway pseudopilin PulG